MRIVHLQKAIYKFDELSREAKNRAKKDYLNDCRSYEWSEYIKAELENVFPHSALLVEWSLNSCQGDGVNVYGSINPEDVFSDGGFTDKEKEIISNYYSECSIFEEYLTIPRNLSYNYCKAQEVETTEIIVADMEETGWDDVSQYAATIEKYRAAMINKAEEFCARMEKEGYEYLYNISDADFQEIAEANDWEFFEDGRLY